MTGSVSDQSMQIEVWEDESFPISVQLTNNGEYTIPAHEVRLEIAGIAPSDFTGIRFLQDNSEPIDKVSDWLPQGGDAYIDFGSARYGRLEGTHYDANIYVKYTYPYETYINIPRVCYKTNIRDTTICTVDSTRQAFASGGPMQIGTVKQSYIGKNKIMLEIPIKNVGQGKSKAFRSDEFRVEWDEVLFEINDPEWECQSRGSPNVARITQPGGTRGSSETIIRCINDRFDGQTPYTKSVTMTLKYFYDDWIMQTVRIRENPDYR
jgi:hypothetical protein